MKTCTICGAEFPSGTNAVTCGDKRCQIRLRRRTMRERGSSNNGHKSGLSDAEILRRTQAIKMRAPAWWQQQQLLQSVGEGDCYLGKAPAFE